MKVVMLIEDQGRKAQVEVYIEDEDITFVPVSGDQELAREAIEEIINADYDDQTEVVKN